MRYVGSGCAPAKRLVDAGLDIGQLAEGALKALAPCIAQRCVGCRAKRLGHGLLQNFRTIVTDTLGKVSAGDQAGAKARITDLESAWDNAQSRLQPMNETAWSFLDGKIDTALKAVRTGTPDAATETQALTDLQNALK